jgi:RNA polymerase sigma-70 factor, ECF subfamily
MADDSSREAEIRRSHASADYDAATTAILRGYGPEIYRFLYGKLRDPELASEAFSQFTEDLWRGISGFEWRSSARVWAYAVARRAASRTIARERPDRGHVPLSQALQLVEQQVRTDTLKRLENEARGRLEEICDELPAEDRTLLLLRVNRELGWKEIAHVLLYNGCEVSDHELDQEATRLRKRFQLLKERLHNLAQSEE